MIEYCRELKEMVSVTGMVATEITINLETRESKNKKTVVLLNFSISISLATPILLIITHHRLLD